MNFRRSVVRSILTATILGLSACGNDDKPTAEPALESGAPADVFVQLFEWRWNDIATECENFLGPAGYAAVQISPPQEHVLGSQWWTRYQPVSYKIESRGGTRAEFANMVKRCVAAGVDIYADALTNHMSDPVTGVGFAGSTYSEYTYPAVPYDYDDFHHCGRNENGSIKNYQDQWEVQNCRLGGLSDLDTSNPSVRAKIAAYLNDLLSLGVAGFRLDAVKHIAHEEVTEILSLVDSSPTIIQEVPDRGNEPINAHDYLGNGSVIEVKYPAAMTEAFLNGNLSSLHQLEKRDGFLPADKAVVFVDNHDLQRGHAGSERILRYKDGNRYDLAIAFMLAYPYGYPMVMSSYYFDNSDQGPEHLSALNEDNSCNEAWVCEHRRHATANMVKFRRETAGTGVTNWAIIDDKVLSFGRGNKGHVIINVSKQAIEIEVPTGLPAGRYCDVIANGVDGQDCTHAQIGVDDDVMTVSMEPLSSVALLAGD
jgi:alpha-amylase